MLLLADEQEDIDEEQAALTNDEVQDLWSQNATANINVMSRSMPKVFTEQGIYMLMTILKGELAERQSIDSESCISSKINESININ